MRWLVLVFVIGCGPIVYVNEVTRRAADKVEEAKAAEADKYAPYYWTRAHEYYEKARAVAAYADYQAANRYGRLASEAAEKAIEEATIAKKDPSKRPLDQQLAPGKDGTPPKEDVPVAPAKEDAPSRDPAMKPEKKKEPAPAPAKDKP